MQANEVFTPLCQAHATLVRQYITEPQVLGEWPALKEELVDSLASEPAWKLALPLLACECAGGDSKAALPVTAAWLCLRHAAHLMDATTDHDPGGLQASGSNYSGLAAALIFAGFKLVIEMAEEDTIRRILKEFSSAGLNSALGQSMFFTSYDSTVSHEDSLELYWQAVILKSGSIFQAGTAGGASVATNCQDWIHALSEYGSALGVMLQVLDDCRDRSDDRIRRTHLPGLPALLEHLLPAASHQALPETLSLILLEWQRRAIQAISSLPDSPALDVLCQIPIQILNPTQVG